MRAKGRIEKLSQALAAKVPAIDGPPFEIRLPCKEGCRPPGRYPFPGAHAVLVLYEVDQDGRRIMPPEPS